MIGNVKALNKMHILAMARHAGLAIQDHDDLFLNDLASEKEVVAFARLIERAVHSSATMESNCRQCSAE